MWDYAVKIITSKLNIILSKQNLSLAKFNFKMSKINVAKWAKDNMVVLVCVPLIVGVHWGWRKLQDVPYLVDPSEKKDEMPLLSALKAFKVRMIDDTEDKSKGSAEDEAK